VAVEYPGYPGASGAPSEESLLAAAEAALQHLTGAMKLDRSRLVLEGQSVGTGVAVAMAAKGWGTRLVLLSPYTSLPDVAASAFGWLPVRLLMRDRFDSKSRAADVKIPTLIVHGTDDEVIPFALGQELGTSILGAKFIAKQGRHHNDLWDDESVQDAVFDFVSEP
jgi:pimeloyl-ACP methyl ester carboxylesterase